MLVAFAKVRVSLTPPTWFVHWIVSGTPRVTFESVWSMFMNSTASTC